MAKQHKILRPDQVPKQEKIENEILEVEVIIPEDVLKKESHFKDIYKNGKLTYDFGSELPENVKSEISEIIKTSKTDEIVQFNPLLIALSDLQKIKELKWDEEERNERDFIDSNKKIGSFNTAIKSTTDEMKKDAAEYVKKVNAIRDFFSTEAKTTRSLLEENFRPLLEERERKKKEAEEKKNAEILKANKELAEKNQEQALKLQNQMKESKKLAIQGEIGKITFSATSGVSVLNLDGLEKLKKETERKAFEEVLPQNEAIESGFTNDEVNELQDQFSKAKETSLNAINVAINNIKATEENKDLKAKQPSNILSDDNDRPFINANQADAVHLGTDSEKIEQIALILDSFNKTVHETVQAIDRIAFDDEKLQKIHDIIVNDSFGQIKEWSFKLMEWTNKKKDLFNQHLKETTN